MKQHHEWMLRQVREATGLAELHQKEAADKSEGLNRAMASLDAAKADLAYFKWLSARAGERRDQAEQRSKDAEKDRIATQRQLEQVTREKKGDLLCERALASIDRLRVMSAQRQLAESQRENHALRLQHESVLLAQHQGEVLRASAQATIYQLEVMKAQRLLALSVHENEKLRKQYESVLVARDDEGQRAMAELERNDQVTFRKEHEMRQEISRTKDTPDVEVESAFAERIQRSVTDVLSATSRKQRKLARSRAAAEAGNGALKQSEQPIWSMKPPGKVER